MTGTGTEEGPEGGPDEGTLVGRTEQLADQALDRLRQEAQLPDVRAEAGRVAATLRSVRSRLLAATLGVFVAAAVAGTALAFTEGLRDWYMHGAMYLLMFSFLVIYVKAHLQRRRVARAVYALVTAGLMVFMAWVLDDLVAPRLVLAGTQVVERPAADLLRLPAALLLACVAGLLVHWLALSRRRPSDG